MMMSSSGSALGVDFGTTNSVVAWADAPDHAQLVPLRAPDGETSVFRSALCFWEEPSARRGMAYDAGPWAIEEYLEAPLDSRFLQSFKSVAASPLFERANIYNNALRFEDMGQMFLERLVHHAGAGLKNRPPRVIVGRPVEYAGARADAALARERYDRMFADFGTELHYVFEPLGAALSYARHVDHESTVLVGDFGGGTTDFSVVKIAERGAKKRCQPLASAGIGIAGDQFDFRLMDRLVLPLLGKGSEYRSFEKLLEIPGGYFADFGNWSKLAMMRNRKTLDGLRKMMRDAVEPEKLAVMIALIENEQGFPLYDAIGKVKRTLSSEDEAEFRFEGGGVDISARVTRREFEQWIAPDLQRIEAVMEQALAKAGVEAGQIDRIFLTGGSSLIPAISALFARRFGADRLAMGDELTSIAYGLALIGMEENPAEWTV
jgi:hypothetical chaperone protein